MRFFFCGPPRPRATAFFAPRLLAMDGVEEEVFAPAVDQSEFAAEVEPEEGALAAPEPETAGGLGWELPRPLCGRRPEVRHALQRLLRAHPDSALEQLAAAVTWRVPSWADAAPFLAHLDVPLPRAQRVVVDVLLLELRRACPPR